MRRLLIFLVFLAIPSIAFADATFGNILPPAGPGGPGIIEFVHDPSLEGNASGTLTLSLAQAASRIGFGLSRSTSSSLTPGAQIVLKAADGSTLGTFNLNTVPLETFSEGFFAYAGAPASTATITFPSPGSASRFAFDNLGIFDGALIKLEGSGALAPTWWRSGT